MSFVSAIHPCKVLLVEHNMFGFILKAAPWASCECEHKITFNVTSSRRPFIGDKETRQAELAVTKREAYRLAFDILIERAIDHRGFCDKAQEVLEVLKTLITKDYV